MFKKLVYSEGKMVAFSWAIGYNRTYRNFLPCLTYPTGPTNGRGYRSGVITGGFFMNGQKVWQTSPPEDSFVAP
jgi:hypothetical protein